MRYTILTSTAENPDSLKQIIANDFAVATAQLGLQNFHRFISKLPNALACPLGHLQTGTITKSISRQEY